MSLKPRVISLDRYHGTNRRCVESSVCYAKTFIPLSVLYNVDQMYA